jgi:hypothetical protein
VALTLLSIVTILNRDYIWHELTGADTPQPAIELVEIDDRVSGNNSN